MIVPRNNPTTFGKYQILERIASGGMAEIFKAKIEGIGGFHRTFAIKRILPHLTSNSEFVDLLVDEARIAGLLSHANIVQILDLGRIDDHYFIAMEYVPGNDLGKVVQKCADKGITLPVPHATFISIEVLKGLEYAHNRQVMKGGRPVPLNIVHRDISPPNILVSYQGEIKITDFGIAKANIKAMETLAGVVKGRFEYYSPEQSDGRAVDQRSDIFSTGIVLYEMLTGIHPFRHESDIATLEAVRKSTFSPPSSVNPDIPYALEQILQKALAADPDERYPTAAAFKESLNSFFHDSGFIFSQSTMAAFLKGLFPTKTSTSRPNSRFPRHATIIPRPDIEDDDEDILPTVIQPISQRRLLQKPSSRDGQRSTLQDESSDPFSEAATLLQTLPGSELRQDPDPLSDAQTLIRSNPLLETDIGEMETQIKPSPLKGPPPKPPAPTSDIPPELSTSASSPSPGEPPREHQKTSSRTAPDKADSYTESKGHVPGESAQAAIHRVDEPRSRTRFGLALSAGALLMLISGLLGFSIGWWSASSQEPMAVYSESNFEFRLPEGSTVFVDGERQSSPTIQVSAGTHQIRIESAEITPQELTLNVEPGERIIYMLK